MFKPFVLALCIAASFSSAAFAADGPPQGPHLKFAGSGNNQYLVARSQNTYMFVDKDVVFTNPPTTEDPIPAVGAPVYVIAKTREGVVPNRLIVIAQCSAPYAVALASREILNKNGKPVRYEESSTKYDSSPSFVVAPSSRLGRVWNVLCNNTWEKSQHWGVLNAGQLIERVSRQTGDQRVVEVYNENISQGPSPQKTQGFSKILPPKN
jgi:hypothetical protein